MKRKMFADLTSKKQQVRFARVSSISQGGLKTNPAKVSAVSGFKMLIVDHDGDVVNQLRSLFDEIATVFFAKSDTEGFWLACKVIPDLILSDFTLTSGDGLNLCRNVKRNPKTKHIPVLLLTSHVSIEAQLIGFEYGADDYVTKPFHPQILQSKVTALLTNRQQFQDFYHRQSLLQPKVISLPDAERSFVQSAVEIVERNLEDTGFNVSILVREIGMSQSVFYRKIKGITGLSPIEFITKVRMNAAVHLLMAYDLKIYEISARVGIDDPKYFRRLFQKYFGVGPAEYARRAS